MSAGMLSFIAGLGGGYLKGQETARKRALEDQDIADKKARREREQAQWKKEDDLEASLRTAAAPVTAKDASVYQPTGDDEGSGEAMPANPTAGRMSVAGKMYSTPEDTSKAVADANTPQATTARMADAYIAAGKPVEASRLRTDARQSELADLQLTETKRKLTADEKWREMGGLIARGGWQAVPDVYKRYDDGLDVTVEEDGKGGATVTELKDGKPTGKPRYFKDLPEMMATAQAQFDPKLWMDDQAARRKDERERKKDESDASYKDRMAKVAEQNAATNERYRRDMTNAAAAKAGAGGQPSAANVSLEDFRKFNGDFASTLPDPKGEVEPSKAAGILADNTKATAAAQAIFQTAAGFGTVLTAPEVRQAMVMAADPRNVQRRENGGLVFETVTVNGKVVPISAPLQKASAASPAAPAAPVAVTPPEQGTGMVGRAIGRVGNAVGGVIDQAQANAAAYQNIRARLVEATQGGAPLNQQEAAMAKQLGMIPG